MRVSVLGTVLVAALWIGACDKTTDNATGAPSQGAAPAAAPSLDDLAEHDESEHAGDAPSAAAPPAAPPPAAVPEKPFDRNAPLPGEPPFEEVLARAKKEGRPIFLDVYTDWCGPCRRLERDVFPHPAVKAQLERYLFQRYDAEKGHGLAVADRFRIDTYPSMLALTPDGFVVEMNWSQEPFTLAGHMEELYGVASVQGPVGPEAMAQRPGDARLAFLSAIQVLRVGGPPRQYRQLLTRAEELDPQGKHGVAPLAAQLRLRAEAPVLPEADKAARLVDFISRFPKVPFAEEAIYGLAATPAELRPNSKTLGAATQKTVQWIASRGDLLGLRRVAEALLVIGEPRSALAAAQALHRQAAGDPRAADLLAEAEYQAGAKQKAISLLEKTLAATPDPSREQRLAQLRAGNVPPPSFERFFSPLD